MTAVTLTEAMIRHLITCPKRVTNPTTREHAEGKHLRRDFRVVDVQDEENFVLFTRQSTVIMTSFTAGLRWSSRTGESVILMRCNGSDHPHTNALENVRLDLGTHIHTATERYILTGRKAEAYAEPCSSYHTMQGALHELMTRCHISGLRTCPDQPELF